MTKLSWLAVAFLSVLVANCTTEPLQLGDGSIGEDDGGSVDAPAGVDGPGVQGDAPANTPDAQACGGDGLACCPGNVCNQGGCCVANKCVAAGGSCGTAGGTCTAGSCSGCGAAGEPCCAKN